MEKIYINILSGNKINNLKVEISVNQKFSQSKIVYSDGSQKKNKVFECTFQEIQIFAHQIASSSQLRK